MHPRSLGVLVAIALAISIPSRSSHATTLTLSPAASLFDSGRRLNPAICKNAICKVRHALGDELGRPRSRVSKR